MTIIDNKKYSVLINRDKLRVPLDHIDINEI